MYKQYQIRYVVQGSNDGVLWHEVANCMSEEEAVEEVEELVGRTRNMWEHNNKALSDN